MTKVILVLQSKTTGRFLISNHEGLWNWTSVRNNNPLEAVMFNALDDVNNLIQDGLDNDNLSLEILGGTPDLLIHAWVEGEPRPKPTAEWVSAFMFPDNCHKDIDKVFSLASFREISVRP